MGAVLTEAVRGELIKEAGTGKFLGSLWRNTVGSAALGGEQLLRAVRNPLRSAKEGWSGMSARGGGILNTTHLSRMTPQEIAKLPEGMRAAIEQSGKKGVPSYLKEMVDKSGKIKAGATHHLKDPTNVMGGTRAGGEMSLAQAYKSGKTKGMFEELSRRGWTGSGIGMTGRAGKYIPVGEKSLFVGFNAPTAYSMVKDRDVKGGDIGATAGWLAAARRPVGLPGFLVASEAGRFLGNKLESGGKKMLSFGKTLRTGEVQPPPVVSSQRRAPQLGGAAVHAARYGLGG